MNLSQKEAAELFGVTQGLWSKYERGIRPNKRRMKQIATLTGVSVEVLAGVA